MRPAAYRIILILVLALTTMSFYSSTQKQKKPKVYTIEIRKMKFIPEDLTVEKGDKVVWVNKDFYPHDITDIKPKSWSSKPFGQNQSWSKVITKEESYYCNLHKVMKGRIHIK